MFIYAIMTAIALCSDPAPSGGHKRVEQLIRERDASTAGRQVTGEEAQRAAARSEKRHLHK